MSVEYLKDGETKGRVSVEESGNEVRERDGIER